MSQIVHEVADGHGIRPAVVARLIPGEVAGQPVTPRTIRNWCTHGLRSRLGVLVRLEHVRMGTRFLTSEAAVQRFLARLNDVEPAAPKPSRRVRAAVAKLKAIGGM